MTTVSHYEVKEKIGEGGMGVVYRALDMRLEREVALKFLSLDFTSESLKERFVQEAKAASPLDHHNICRIHDIEETDEGQLFISMGYYQGETVKALLREQGPLPWQDIVKLSAQIASGLQAAHKHRIIHLDIKPANLMVTPGGQVKILDFGLSRFTSEIDRTRPQGPLMGTVAYMAPELVQGEETGPQCDLWALGVVMYEMATGQRPFQGKNDMAVFFAIVHKDFTDPCERAPEMPEELGRIIRRALVKDRRHRYQSATEILADLEPLQQQSSDSNMPPPIGPRQKMLRRAAGAVAAIVPVLLIVLLFLYREEIERFFERIKPRIPHTDIVLVSFGDRTPETEDDWLGTALAEMIMCRLPDNERMSWVPSEEIVLSRPSSAADVIEPELVFDAQTGLEPSILRQLRNREIEWALGGEGRVIEEDSGARFVIDGAVQDARTGAIERFTDSVPIAELPELAVRVADALLPFLEVAVPQIVPTDEAAEMPKNPEALRLLSEAQRKLRVMAGQSARDDLLRAIELDRESPILYLTLSEAENQLYREKEAQMAAADAMQRVRRLPWRDQIYYCAWQLELQGKQDSATAIYRAWWAANGQVEDAADPLTLDRGLHLATALARSRQSAAALAVADRLRPLLADDPRVPLIEVQAYRDEAHEDEQAAAARAVELAREKGVPLLEGRALILDAQAWQRLGEYDRAIADLERAREIYSSHGYRGGAAAVLTVLGNVQTDQRKYSDAKASHANAVKLFGEIGNATLRARGLLNVAVVYDNEGKLGAAIKIARQAIANFNDEGNRDAYVSALLNLSEYQIARGQFKEAGETLDDSFAVLDSWRNSRLRSITLTRLGHLRSQQGSLLEARDILTQAVENLEKTKDQLWTAFARSLLGTVYYHLGQLPDALREQQRALEGYGEDADGIRADIGRSLMAMCDLDGAREHFDKAREGQITLSNPGPAAQTRLYQAQLHLAERRIEDSVTIAREVLADLAANRDFVLVRSQAHVVLGSRLLELGEAEEAQQELDSARTLLADVDSPLYELPVDILEGRLMAYRGEPRARDYLQDALADALTLEFTLLQFEIQLALAEIELRTGSGKTGRNQLQVLAEEARQKGYCLVAMLAERAAR